MQASSERVDIAPGVSSEIRFWRNPDDTAPALLILPAMGIPVGAYRRVAEALCAIGCHVLSIDLRGIGSSNLRATRSTDWGYADLVHGELAVLLSYARAQLPQSRLYWCGHSLGGHLAVIHSLEQVQAQLVNGLILVASGSPQLDLLPSGVRRQARFLVLTVRVMLALLGVFRGDWVGFGSRQSATLMREWSGFVTAGRMPMGDRRLPPDAATPIRTLAMAMQGDDYAPKAAATALLQRLGVAQPVVTIQATGDEPTPGHTAWLKAPPREMLDRLASFLNDE